MSGLAVIGLELWTAVLVVVAAVSVLTVILIVVAPWKQVRSEPKIDPTAETKLLLHQDPDEPTGEFSAITPIDPVDGEDLADLEDLDSDLER